MIPAELNKALALARRRERDALGAYQKARPGGNREGIRSARRAVSEAQEQVERVAARIQREAKAAASVTLGVPDDLPTIRSYLQPREALVLLGATSEEAVAVVVRRDEARVVTLPAYEELEAAVADLALDDPGEEASKGVARLRTMLTSPLALGTDVKRVLVSPAGRLGYVPYALLFPDKEIVYTPSGTTLGLLREDREKRGEKILAVGDPDYGTLARATVALHRGSRFDDLVRLPATRAEVEAIGTTRLLGAAASESALAGVLAQEPRWRAVHFACHGLVDPERPMLSALALTADAQNDGFLRALEIFRMKIPADLVVLSACETGRGRVYKTEGIVGLARAFMFAGAPRVICSLWKVDDEATQVLMRRFYELWAPPGPAKDGVGAAAALKRAQAHVRDHPDHPEWKHPYYWAAWVLWGLGD